MNGPNFLERAALNLAAGKVVEEAGKAVVRWIDEERITPDQLREWAEQGRSVFADLIRRIDPNESAQARGLFAGVARTMGEKQIWNIVRSNALATRLEHRKVLEDHWPWFRDQMMAAKQWLARGR